MNAKLRAEIIEYIDEALEDSFTESIEQWRLESRGATSMAQCINDNFSVPLEDAEKLVAEYETNTKKRS